jgi:hypothetical protein
MTSCDFHTFDSLQYPLSDSDIHEAFKGFSDRANIKRDDQIKPNTPIEKIFANRGHVILFHQYPHQRTGHWYAMTRDDKGNVLIFDSLGHRPDYYNKSILPFLKNNGIKSVVYNEKKLQGDTSVCGRYAILISILNKMNLPINKIYDFFEGGKQKHKTYDKFVLDITTQK